VDENDRSRAAGRPEEWPADRVLQALGALVALWSSARRRAAPGLTDYQVEALETIDRAREINQAGLAHLLSVGPSACSRLCGRLVAAGLLEQRAHPARRREVLLTVTTHGRRVIGEIAAHRRAALGGVLRRMHPRERAALIEGLCASARQTGATDP
jgi:DNA-binding MarR family transcriptional regulator